MITQTAYTFEVGTENPVTDVGLIHACRLGDADAWSTLVNRYQRLIYTIPRRAGLDEEQAAEVFQCTFAKLLEHLDRIRQPASIQAWLVTTARRATLQLRREQSAELSFWEDFDERGKDEVIPDDGPLPDETLESLEEQHLIHHAIAALDERSRKMVALLYYHPKPLSYAEIAAMLHIPEGSVGPTRARCLEKLRRQLECAGYRSIP